MGYSSRACTLHDQDEIGDIPAELQPKLLRVLQEQEFEHLGSTQTIKVNVRVVAATSRKPAADGCGPGVQE